MWTDKDIMLLPEAAKYLGFSKHGLYGLTKRKQIPFSRPSGKTIYFSRRELDVWAMSRPVGKGGSYE